MTRVKSKEALIPVDVPPTSEWGHDASHIYADKDTMNELKEFAKWFMGELARFRPMAPTTSNRGMQPGQVNSDDVAEEPACPTCPDYANVNKHAVELQKRIDTLENELRKAQAQVGKSKTDKVNLTNRIDTLENGLGDARELWEESRANNVDLTKRLSDRTEKLTSLQKFLARTGKAEDQPMDADIEQKFVAFKNDIHQYVKDHIDLSQQPSQLGVTGELREALMRSHISNLLYDNFFAPGILPLGSQDHIVYGNPLRWFQDSLVANQCDESLFREWRVATVKASRCLNPDFDLFSTDVAAGIWNDQIVYRIHPMINEGSLRAAQSDLIRLCRTAVDLALLFSASNIEYRWEQCALLPNGEVHPSEHDVVAVEGGDQGQGELEVSFIVFGGVARGDKRTGLLADGRVSLSRSQVAARRRQQDSRE